MAEAIPTFWLEEAFLAEYSLRRYALEACPARDQGFNLHEAVVPLAHFPYQRYQRRMTNLRPVPGISTTVPPGYEGYDWPTACATCGQPFFDGDYYQVTVEALYRAADDRLFTLLNAPVGALWDGVWYPDTYRGPDGIALFVRTPGGDWAIDSQARNCTRQGEPHQCWVRHGNPRTEPITVDKQGDTCAAGAGSILIGDYHAFLRDGVLVPA